MLTKNRGLAIAATVILAVAMAAPLVSTMMNNEVKLTGHSMASADGIRETVDDLSSRLISLLPDDLVELLQKIVDRIETFLVQFGPNIDIGTGVVNMLDFLSDIISDAFGLLIDGAIAISTPSWFVEALDLMGGGLSTLMDLIGDAVSAFLATAVDFVDAIGDITSDIGTIIAVFALAISTPSWLYEIAEAVGGSILGALGLGVLCGFVAYVVVDLANPIPILDAIMGVGAAIICGFAGFIIGAIIGLT